MRSVEAAAVRRSIDRLVHRRSSSSSSFEDGSESDRHDRSDDDDPPYLPMPRIMWLPTSMDSHGRIVVTPVTTTATSSHRDATAIVPRCRIRCGLTCLSSECGGVDMDGSMVVLVVVGRRDGAIVIDVVLSFVCLSEDSKEFGF